MALPSSGTISLNMVNVELSKSGTTLISLNQSDVRNLFGKSSGQISMSDGHGKSAYTQMAASGGSKTTVGSLASVDQAKILFSTSLKGVLMSIINTKPFKDFLY